MRTAVDSVVAASAPKRSSASASPPVKPAYGLPIKKSPSQPLCLRRFANRRFVSNARALRFSALDAICRELKCQSGDVIEWTGGASDVDAA